MPVPAPQVKVVGCLEGAVFPPPFPAPGPPSAAGGGGAQRGLWVLVGVWQHGCVCVHGVSLQGTTWVPRCNHISAGAKLGGGGGQCSSVAPLGVPHIRQGPQGKLGEMLRVEVIKGGLGGSAGTGDPAEDAILSLQAPWCWVVLVGGGALAPLMSHTGASLSDLHLLPVGWCPLGTQWPHPGWDWPHQS